MIQASVKNGMAVAGLAILAASLADGSQAPLGPQFESTVARIVVDAIVTDSEGEFFDDLVAEDFVILEDGSEQRVLNAQYVDLGGEPDPGNVADREPSFEDVGRSQSIRPIGGQTVMDVRM